VRRYEYVELLGEKKIYIAVPLHATEALVGTGGIAPTYYRPRHLMGGEWLASRPSRALAPGKGPPVPIVQEAG
jgi:hypothetical protein